MTARIALAVMVVAGVSAAAAQKTSLNLHERESSGFNALNHVLQKPLGNTSFPEDDRGFGRHMYFGFNAGGSFINNNLSGSIRPGYNVGAHFGGWFTPVHGLRVTSVGGRHSVHSGVTNAWYGSLRADYMMNLSSLLYGYNPARTFELIGAYGVIFQHMTQNGHRGNNYGGAASLQMRFNVGSSLYLFLEPEVSVIGGKKYDTGISYYRMYTDLGLNVGLGYRILTGKSRQDGATPFIQSKEDNLFFGIGGGIFTFPGSGLTMTNPMVSIFVGKMFSCTSGLQLSGSFGKKRHWSGDDNGYSSVASLDYVLNLNNALSGYRPDATFQMLLNMGASAGVVHRTNKVHPGIQAGITGLFRLSDNWGIFIHPQIYNFTKAYTTALGIGKHPMVTVDLGVRYTIGDFTRLHKENLEEFPSSHRWFVNIGGGGGLRFRSGRPKLFDGYIGIGKRITPISSWRLNIEGESVSHCKSATLGLDYLASITTSMLGYNPSRIFDLQAVAGVFGGAAKYDGGSMTSTFGAKGGLQANFNITPNFDLYLEPEVLGLYCPSSKGSKYWTPDARVQIGLKYKW